MYGFVHGSDSGVDNVPMHIKFEYMFASINSAHLITDQFSLTWKSVVEKIVHSTLAIPLLFLNINH